MAIRLPLKTVLSSNNAGEDGTNSTLGGLAVPFTIPQDTDNIVVKMQATTTGGGVSATLQTTDDGGSTWFDVAKTSVVSSATGALSQWFSVPVISAGIGTAVTQTTSSVYTATIGTAAASSLGSQRMSGLPILSQQARLFLQMQAAAVGTTWLTEVKVNSQSATA